MEKEEIVSRCHDIQVSLGNKDVPEFEDLTKIGMMVNLSIHIKGLPLIQYDILRQVASHYFKIPSPIFRTLILELAEIEFVQILTENKTIKTVLPTVPFFDNVYGRIGEYSAVNSQFNEPELIAIKLLSKLSQAPTEKSNLFSIGADTKTINRSLDIGQQGGYFISKRTRGRDIFLSPLFFSENAEIYSDIVVQVGAKKVQRVLELIKKSQGWPLSIIEKTMKVGQETISPEELSLLKQIAQDGAIKPPSISTPSAGTNYFLFTPTPGGTKLNPTNKEIYEKAIAIISTIRQGQLLADRFSIRNPLAILNKLKTQGKLGSNTEALNQYKSLANLRIGKLVHTGGGWYSFQMIQSEENDKALDIAISILQTGEISNLEINNDARIALQKDQKYIDSIISTNDLRNRENVPLDHESQNELDDIFLKLV